MIIIIKISGKKAREYLQGVKAGEVLKNEQDNKIRYPIIAALVNNDLVSLTYQININSTIKPLTIESRQGINIYRRSLCFLLTIASKQLFPNRRLIIGHSLGKGYYYYYDGIDGLLQSDIEILEQKMRSIVQEDLPIIRQLISYTEALLYFKENNQPDTALLLKNRNDNKIPIYICGDFIDIAYSPLAPRTGMLNIFEIRNYKPGFLLRYPPLKEPQNIPPFEDNKLLFSIYQEYKRWGKILNINCIGRLNEMIETGKIRQFIEVAEALHDKKIAQIADKISKNIQNIRLVLIAGPSSSGKTTFSKKLTIQLKVNGLDPVEISIDNYFLPHEKTPLDENGNLDFETIKAIDIEKLNRNILELLSKKETVIPLYNFRTGKRKTQGRKIYLQENSILLLEGIHCLNNELTPQIAEKQKYKIYVSALTQLNLDDHNRIPTTDVRLLRRMVRDNQFRGHTAIDTFKMWPSVRHGEDKNIFPYQNNADSAFNSSLDYELAVLKVYCEPLLKTVKPDIEFYYEARRLINFLNNVIPLPPTRVPSRSILREFIGDSAFIY